MNLYDFGKLPIVNEGRTKPIGHVRRCEPLGDFRQAKLHGRNRRKTAGRCNGCSIFIADPKAADKHQVFYICNPELLDSLGLIRTKSHYYSIAEISKHRSPIAKNADKKTAADDDDRGLTASREFLQVPAAAIAEADAMDPSVRESLIKSACSISGRRLMAYVGVVARFRCRPVSQSSASKRSSSNHKRLMSRPWSVIRRWDRPPKDDRSPREAEAVGRADRGRSTRSGIHIRRLRRSPK